jgi:hypothetical protein
MTSGVVPIPDSLGETRAFSCRGAGVQLTHVNVRAHSPRVPAAEVHSARVGASTHTRSPGRGVRRAGDGRPAQRAPTGRECTALPAPTEREKSEMYVQRYLPHCPAAGEIVIFDRSWYNRAGVERVMGFCTEEQARRFLKMVPLVEKAMVDSGIILLKYWLEVSPEEQTRRLAARIDDGRKIWKLSPMDLRSCSRWYDCSRARDEMFAATDTDFAPWYVARSDDKKRARLNIVTHLLGQIPYKTAPREKVKLPKRRKPGDYRDPKYPFKFIKERF